MDEALWLLVKIDRHHDDEFNLFQAKADALSAARDFASMYEESLRDWSRYGSREDRWFTSGDDGPRCRILKVTVAPVRARPEEDRRER